MAKSQVSHAQLDRHTRSSKAAKIIAVLESRMNLSDLHVLDIGTGSGFIAHSLSRHAKKVTSVDLHDERQEKKGYTFVSVGDERLPFRDDQFDVVITNHVIEHIPRQKNHLREIYRVLKPGGYVYLSTPNKYWLWDPHHKLPFISWFPRSISNVYLKLFKGREWDIYPLSYWKIKRMTRRFSFTCINPYLFKYPRKYHEKTLKVFHPIFRILPFWFPRLITPFYPTYVTLLRKHIKKD